MNFQVFGMIWSNTVLSSWYIFSVQTKTKGKNWANKIVENLLQWRSDIKTRWHTKQTKSSVQAGLARDPCKRNSFTSHEAADKRKKNWNAMLPTSSTRAEVVSLTQSLDFRTLKLTCVPYSTSHSRRAVEHVNPKQAAQFLNFWSLVWIIPVSGPR